MMDVMSLAQKSTDECMETTAQSQDAIEGINQLVVEIVAVSTNITQVVIGIT